MITMCLSCLQIHLFYFMDSILSSSHCTKTLQCLPWYPCLRIACRCCRAICSSSANTWTMGACVDRSSPSSPTNHSCSSESHRSSPLNFDRECSKRCSLPIYATFQQKNGTFMNFCNEQWLYFCLLTDWFLSDLRSWWESDEWFCIWFRGCDRSSTVSECPGCERNPYLIKLNFNIQSAFYQTNDYSDQRQQQQNQCYVQAQLWWSPILWYKHFYCFQYFL